MNIIEALDSAGIEWHPSETDSSEISICCPFCIDEGETEDTRFRLGINTIHGKAHCFNCNWGSHNNTFEKILEALKIEVEEDEEEELPKHVKKVKFDGKLPDGFEPLYPLKRDKTFQQAYFYLINRGVSEQQIKSYNIGFTLVGKYSYRIIFPVYDDHHNLCGFVGRDFTGKQKLRYLNSVGKKALYGKIHKNRSIAMIVEGIFDKLAIDRAIKNVDSFALLQRTIRDEQLHQLRYYDRIIRIPDDNRPGLTGLIKDCNKMVAEGFNVWYSRLSKKYEDVNYALTHKGKKDIEDLLKNSIEWNEHEERMLKLEIANDYRGVKAL